MVLTTQADDCSEPFDAPETVHVWRIALDVAPGALSAHRACLSPQELARAARFRRPEDAARFVVGRSCLRQVLGSALGRPASALTLGTGPYGKPSLEPPDDGAALAFNLAHSGGLAVVAITRGPAVGVDVERVRQGVEAAGLAERHFTPAERRQLAALPHGVAYEAFFDLWTAKEAMVKALGRGMFLPLDGLDVLLDGSGRIKPQRVVVRREDGPGIELPAASNRPASPDAFDMRTWWLTPFPMAEGYRGALAVAGNEARVVCEDWPA